MKSTCTLECADSACPTSSVSDGPESEGVVPTENASRNTSTPSVIFDLWNIDYLNQREEEEGGGHMGYRKKGVWYFKIIVESLY